MARKYSSTNTKYASSRVQRPQTAATQNHQLMVLVATVLFLALAFVSLKYFLARESWMQYGNQAQDKILNYPTRDSINAANTVAATVLNFPAGTPLWEQQKLLQNYVDVVSKQTGRDLVIIDVDGTILADTVAGNAGKKWAEDKEGEVMLTITDGKPRDFQEVSADYPVGLMQVVVPVKDDSGKIYGAVVLSSETTP